jgi:hypothetical protein
MRKRKRDGHMISDDSYHAWRRARKRNPSARLLTDDERRARYGPPMRPGRVKVTRTDPQPSAGERGSVAEWYRSQ